jgi:hypothetical protein
VEISWLVRDALRADGVVEEEADESEYWLEMIIEGGLKSKLPAPLLAEANELVAILTSSRISAVRTRAKAMSASQSQCGNAKDPISKQKSASKI